MDKPLAKQWHLVETVVANSIDHTFQIGNNPTFQAPPQNDRRCLCKETYWILKMSQLSGMYPLIIKCNAEENYSSLASSSDLPRLHGKSSRVTCSMTKVKLSYPYINSVAALLVFFAVSWFLENKWYPVLKTIFKAIDAYAFRIHFTFRISQTIMVIFYGLAFNHHFIRAWVTIQSVALSLKHEFPPVIRKMSGILAVACWGMCMGNAGYTIYMGFILCIADHTNDTSDGHYFQDFQKKCHEFGLTTYFILAWVVSSSECIHLTCSALLIVMTWVVRSLHANLAKLMKAALAEDDDGHTEIVERHKYFGLKQSDISRHEDRTAEIERIRLLYEELNEGVVHLRNFFGPPCLSICLCTIVTCVVGMYWRFIYFENWADGSGRTADVYHIILFSIHLTYSIYSMLTILVSGHILVTSALDTSKAIRKSQLGHLNSASRFQVNMIMQVTSGFPTRLSVYSITNLEMSFLAAATTNVITYLLVLMQFRLDQDRKSM